MRIFRMVISNGAGMGGEGAEIAPSPVLFRRRLFAQRFRGDFRKTSGHESRASAPRQASLSFPLWSFGYEGQSASGVSLGLVFCGHEPASVCGCRSRCLHLPTTRLSGADPYKLHRQIARFGASIIGMPPPEVYRGSDGEFVIYNGVTRATRAAKLLPGHLISIEIVDDLSKPVGHLPTIGSALP